MKNTEDT